MSESRPRFENESFDPAFRASVRAETIRTAIESVHALVSECRVRLAADGLHIAATDPATVASVTLDVAATAFDTYEGNAGLIGVDVDRLVAILGVADRDQSVEFALDAESGTLHVAVERLEYTMALIDPESIRSPPDPSKLDFEYAAETVIESNDLNRAVRAGDMVADHVAIGMEEDDALYVEAEGDTDDISLTLEDGDRIESSPGPAHSLFSLDYLADIDRAIPADSELRLQLGEEIPLAIDYDIADETGTVEYVLAPRMAAY